MMRGDGPVARSPLDRTSPPDRPAVGARPADAPAPDAQDRGPIVPRSASDLGTAREQGLGGFVRSDAGVDVAGAACELYEETGAAKPQEGALRDKQATDAAGAFFFDRATLVEADRYLLKIRHPSFAMARRVIEVKKPGSCAVNVTMHAGVAVSGTVRSDSGRVISGAAVTIYDLDQPSIDPPGSVEGQMSSDGEGIFSFPHVSPGKKRVVASREGFGSASSPDFDVEAGTPVVGVNFVLKGAVLISGQVWTMDGRPISGARVTARPMGAKRGAAKVSEAVPGGAVQVAAAVQPTQAPDGDDDEPDAALPASGAGAASPGRGAGKQDDASRGAVLSNETQSNGSFLISGAEAGVYAVSVSAPGFIPAAESMVAAPAQGINIMLARDPAVPLPGSEKPTPRAPEPVKKG